MPSFGESFGLGALTSWLSGFSMTDKDGMGSSEKLKENAHPEDTRASTTWSEMVGGKTFEQAMVAVMADMPPSPTDAEKADELANVLEATTLSENLSSKDEPDGYIDIGNAEEPSSVNVAVQNSSDLNSGCQSRDKILEKENAVTEIMEAAGSLRPGSTEYFDAISHVYNHSPSQIAYGAFLKRLIKTLKEQNWIPLDSKKESGVKVVDYGAGTGLLSHAFAPYVTEILAIDKSAKMVEEYNKIVAKENKTGCEMKAVRGDMTSHYLTGKRAGIEEPEGVSAGFDVVAMCLVVNFFTHEDVDEDAKHKELVRALDIMINLLHVNGTLLIIDVEKCDEDCYSHVDSPSPGSPHEGLKVTGHGSKDIEKALEELGMEDIAILVEEDFLFEVVGGGTPDSPALRRKEEYFVVKAKRGPLFEERVLQRSEGSSEAR